MKSQIAPIDISIVSEYLGRFQTAIVTLLVFSIAGHAWFTRDVSTDRKGTPLSVSVPPAAGSDVYEPLGRLFARRTGRTVTLSRGPWDDSAEVYVMPAVDFVEHRERLGLRAVFAMGAAPHDQAVIVVAGATQRIPAPGEVLLAGPRSLNGCWVQLTTLAAGGGEVPHSLDSLRWASGDDLASIVYAVVHGRAQFGACRRSDVEALVESGGLAPDEVRVVVDAPAVPEWIVAARAPEVPYLEEALEGTSRLFAEPSLSEADRDVMELLSERGVGSFRPASRSQLDRVEAACGFMSARTPGNP